MADREDFATAVGALIKGRAPVGSTPRITEVAATRRVALTTPAGTVLEIGNTGPRALNATHGVAGMVAGTLYLSRDGADVIVSAPNIDVQATGTHLLYTLPLGFRPKTAAYETTVAYFGTDTGNVPVRAFPGGALNLAAIPAYPSGQAFHRFNFTIRFATSDAWPTALPGN